VARSEARILVSIWTDPDFLALGPDAQRAYMFLVSQPDLTHTGVLPLRVRRWAKAAAGLTVQVLAEALRELERSRFVVADRDSEELLVRSFIRRDKVYKQPQVFRAAADSLGQISSPLIRRVLLDELNRIAAEDMVEQSRAILAGMLAALAEPTIDPAPDPAGHPEPDPDPQPARTPPGERGVVTDVGTGFPVPLSPKPQAPDPGPLTLASRAAPPSAQNLITEWVDNCRTPPSKRTVGAVAKHVRALLDDHQDPEHVRAGLDLWRRKGADPSSLHSFVNQVANAEPRGSPNGRASPSTGTLRAQTAIEAGRIVAAAIDRKEITL
jgi:hypothetical protein